MSRGEKIIVEQSRVRAVIFVHGHDCKRSVNGKGQNIFDERKNGLWHEIKKLSQEQPKISFGSRIADTPGRKKMHRFRIPQLLFMRNALYFILSFT